MCSGWNNCLYVPVRISSTDKYASNNRKWHRQQKRIIAFFGKLTHNCGLEIDKDSPGNVFSSSGFGKKCWKAIVNFVNGLIQGHGSVWQNAVLKTIELPTGIAWQRKNCMKLFLTETIAKFLPIWTPAWPMCMEIHSRILVVWVNKTISKLYLRWKLRRVRKVETAQLANSEVSSICIRLSWGTRSDCWSWGFDDSI